MFPSVLGPMFEQMTKHITMSKRQSYDAFKGLITYVKITPYVRSNHQNKGVKWSWSSQMMLKRQLNCTPKVAKLHS